MGRSTSERLVIDGSHGEGGGQILRTALACSAVTGRPVRLERIRAGRRKPGLAAQHLTAIRALAAICRARLAGDALGSLELEFEPQASVTAGAYRFDVAEASHRGSAGAATLVLQAVLLPLALASGRSRIFIRGGTHVAWSPPFDYLDDVWRPALERIGLVLDLRLLRFGWYPAGRGAISAAVDGLGSDSVQRLRPLSMERPGELQRVQGRAVATDLPPHVAERMAGHARALLADCGVEVEIGADVVRAACPGAGIFLTAQYEKVSCGFNALGRRGKRAEEVAEEAVQQLLAHRASGTALDLHLADQVLVPLAFCPGASRFSTERVSRHLETNAWVIERFGLARIAIERRQDGSGQVTVESLGFA